jgi:cation diffusion facilitator family transporter
MHAHSIDRFRHDHVFLGADHVRNERRTWGVIVLCSAMMIAEISGGLLFGSMALLADGLHMSTHAGALLIAALAYTYARRHARDERFAFGTGKLGELAGYTSALVLAMIALLIGYESVLRLYQPVAINFNQALPIAGIGFGVNLLSAWLLRNGHDHLHAHDAEGDHEDHDHHARHDHSHAHPHHGRDLNLRAAYVHVMADAAVSILAIVGLLAGRELGWRWMDPLMGIVGACVIANWSWGLILAAGGVLLDMSPGEGLATAIKEKLETGSDRVADLHLWRIGPGHHAVIASVVTDRALPPEEFKARLRSFKHLSHVTIEVERCPGPHAA